LLPILVMIHPEKGKEQIKPTGSENNTAPNAASVSPMVCCTVAIRDAQLEKHKPAIKNKAPTARRNIFLLSLTDEIAVFIISKAFG
jgi:hypothetical protein